MQGKWSEPLKKFSTFTGLVAALDISNVDTDQIVPKQFLKLVDRDGFGQYLFFHHRFMDDGDPNPDFVLHRPRYDGATILLARENFGCGSSREHAPWALLDYGFTVLIAPSFADIFKTNCFKNGILPVELPNGTVDEWFGRVEATSGYTITVDLANQTLVGSDGFSATFDVDPFLKSCLLEGLDDISLTLGHEAAVEAYEQAHRKPWQARIIFSGKGSEVLP
jgi:3-isopropylmalate/(R)-2-methylmalate dehydratase small subunit